TRHRHGGADQEIAHSEWLSGQEHPQRRRRDGVGAFPQALGHRPLRRAEEGRLCDLQQAAAQPEPADVPLVLMSSEETQAVLDQHKKLKAHADEYMLKPFAGKDLLVKIGGLLKVNLSAPAEDDEVHELDADSDIVMADDDDVDIVSSAAADENDEGDATLAVDPNNYGVVAESASGGDTSQQEILPEDGAPATPFEGEKFDPETQAAFAAL